MGTLLPPTHLQSLVEMISNGLRNVNLDSIGDFIDCELRTMFVTPPSRPHTRPPLAGLASLLRWFDFAIEVEGIGVTCQGSKAPVYLLINICLIIIIIVLFDSNLYFVAKAGTEFR